ncbi:ribosome-releasing factor 2, mitochondrial [Microplitis mediator]|uniref:ribosome-releasing factor 2, mitochondrial n=1 Tax=Microplitis mediator TaxID=375433 RepID=UPI002554B995|nr:ribosome-releasing factor 2, mitochondrial [Microplitis mediator]
MLIRNLSNKLTWCKFRARYYSKESVSKSDEQCRVSMIRNIGIMAHIDAGKTTTTERMLYYSGSIKNMGEVHHGNTVTDYMEQERQRGITIVSAAVTFNWKDHRFNLIDTPGHIDFTMGVEQTLGVLDGAVVILDGSAGVEAQTRTVWKQADRYSIPRIVYVNKMDRADANFHMCLESMESKFEITSLPVQLPIKNDSGFVGILDLLTLDKIIFDKNTQGNKILREKLTETEDGFLLDRAREKRRLLVDKLSTIDDELANYIIEQESLDDIPTQVILNSLRKCTIKGKGIPVLLGSSYKNIGVQPLMDAVIFYLPSPDLHMKAKLYSCFEKNLSARAFKIIHDKQRGPITFFRVYSGSLKKNQKFYNVTREKQEQGGRLYAAYADDYEEINEVTEGNIGGLAGCKFTVTGDLLTSGPTMVSRAKSVLEKIKNIDDAEKEKFFAAAKIPDPVFFCSIEPPSLSAQTPLDIALQELEREDPSLRVTLNEETGQTVLGGMGELHIDIIKERIKTEYKIDVDLGPLQIAYKETVVKGIKDTFVSQHKIGTTNHNVNVTMSLIPNYEGKDLLFDKTKESASNIADIHPKVMSAVRRGVVLALNHGPKLGCPVIDVGVKLHWLEVGRGTSDTMISSAISQCIRKMLEQAGIMLLEPIMRLEVVMPEEYSSRVMSDLSKRRAQIQEVTVRGQYKVLRALVPLSELMGYSTTLRILTSGNGNFSSEFDSYQMMGAAEEQQAIKQITGF